MTNGLEAARHVEPLYNLPRSTENDAMFEGCPKLAKYFVLFSAALAVLGCATIFNDTSPPVSIGSEPAGADVYVDGNFVGRTPAVIELSTKSHHTVVFKKEGYADRTYLLQTHTGALWVVLDVLGGLIPIIIDIATGDWQELNEENINVVLEPVG